MTDLDRSHIKDIGKRSARRRENRRRIEEHAVDTVVVVYLDILNLDTIGRENADIVKGDDRCLGVLLKRALADDRAVVVVSIAGCSEEGIAHRYEHRHGAGNEKCRSRALGNLSDGGTRREKLCVKRAQHSRNDRYHKRSRRIGL